MMIKNCIIICITHWEKVGMVKFTCEVTYGPYYR